MLVYTIKELCRTCYTCVRECPAKAIRIVGGQAEVIDERCIACGNCTKVCSQGAKVFLNTTGRVVKLLENNSKVAAIIAPSFPAEFSDIPDHHILTGMIKAEAKQKYSEEVEELSNGLYHKVKGSEDYDSFRKRVVRCFEKIIKNEEYDVCAVISHSGPIRCIFREALKLEEPEHIGDCEVIGLEKKNSKISIFD